MFFVAILKTLASSLQKRAMPHKNYTFSLKFYTFSLKLYTFSLKLYTFRLKVKFYGGLANFFSRDGAIFQAAPENVPRTHLRKMKNSLRLLRIQLSQMHLLLLAKNKLQKKRS